MDSALSYGMRHAKAFVSGLIVGAGTIGMLGLQSRPSSPQRVLETSAGVVELPSPLGVPDSLPLIEMRNVNLHATDHARLFVRELRGQVTTAKAGTAPV